MLRSRPGLLGPGHNCVVRDPQDDDRIVFHAWDTDRTAHRMHVAALSWQGGRPTVAGISS